MGLGDCRCKNHLTGRFFWMSVPGPFRQISQRKKMSAFREKRKSLPDASNDADDAQRCLLDGSRL